MGPSYLGSTTAERTEAVLFRRISSRTSNIVNGPLNSGILGSYGSYHIGPEALIDDPNDPLVTRLVPQDSEIFHGTAFVKYNKGRFFFNGEAAWVYWTDRWHADPAQVVGFPNTRYVEQWRFAAEWGWLIGPAKLSLLQAWTPGPDRRNGTLIGKQPAAFCLPFQL